jgi:prepilin-type N-terminal cleavage/methylation domain-containing protein
MTTFGQIRRDPQNGKKEFSTHKGFTVIELMIIVAVIAIILAMAVPAYSNYFIRAIIDQSLSVASSAKTSIIFACQEDSTLTNLSKQAIGLNFKATKNISNIELGGDCDAPTITITTKATGAQLDPVLTITGEFNGDTQRMTWTCVSDGLNAHVPESCQS